jgi:hypothetical protein
VKQTHLKPGKGLQRTAPSVPKQKTLDADRAWRRDSQLAALKRARVRPVGPAEPPRKRKPPKLTGEAAAKRLVTRRSGGLCEVRVNGLCARWGRDFSHRVARSQGGMWTASDGLHACRFCHSAVTDTHGNRALYVANGWILDRRHDPDGRLVLLAAYGGEALEEPVVALLTSDGRAEVIGEYAAWAGAA